MGSCISGKRPGDWISGEPRCARTFRRKTPICVLCPFICTIISHVLSPSYITIAYIQCDLAWPQFRGHHDRPQGEAGKNGAPWQTNGGSSRVSSRWRWYAALSTVAEVARSLGIDPSLLYGWIRLLKAEDKQAFRGNGKLTAHDEKIRRLRRQLAGVTEERDILKKRHCGSRSNRGERCLYSRTYRRMAGVLDVPRTECFAVRDISPRYAAARIIGP